MLAEHDLCTGCGACYNICPQNAIKMIPDDKGFLIPLIEKDKCIECGLCNKACHINNSKIKKHNIRTYAYKIDESERMESQSGGAFWSLVKYVIDRNGVVYGAALINDVVAHVRCDTLKECERLRKSKYSQSDINTTYNCVASDLKSNNMVLFSGTPCQVSGLYKFLEAKRQKTDNLITCDLICHGVPSPILLKDYISYFEKKYDGKIKEFVFRDKIYGWGTHFESFYINEKKYKSRVYTDLFYNNSSLRMSCGNCQYTMLDRVGDFTIADCWGIERIHPEIYDKKGVSLLISNTDTAEQIIKNNFSDKCVFIEYDFSNQPNVFMPTKIDQRDRELFWHEYKEKGFEYLIKKYTTYGLKNKFNNKVKDYIFNLKKSVKKIIRYK